MSGRTSYKKSDEDFLAQYIAKYNPLPEGRSGNVLYQRLVDNEDGKWPWAKRHTWQSWRNHYVTNRARMDHKIAKHIKPGRIPEPATLQKPPPVTPRNTQTASSSQKKRLPFTKEDDQNIVDFLANASPDLGATKGQKLWITLEEDPDRYPWAQKRGWQSWRERYVKHAEYFDHAVKKQLRGDPDDEAEDDIPRPKTVEDYRVRKRPSQAALSAPAENLSPAKRKRVSGAAQDAPPPKKKKRQAVPLDEEEQPQAGPSRHRSADPEDAEEGAEVQGEAQPDAVDEDEEARENDDGKGSDEDADEDEEDQGPIGSDDYHGQIFDSPDRREDTDSSDSSEHEREDELFKMLTDDLPAEVHDDDEVDGMEVDEAADETMVGLSGDVGNNSHDAVQDSGPSGTDVKPIPSSPPARRHHPRLERELDRAYGTPPLSPTEEAQARHHLEHDHSPAPALKRVPRIRRTVEEEFFGTPQSNSATAFSSPTSHHLVHVRKHDLTDDDDDDVEPGKQREPPRLEESAWTKAFSDARGKSRVSATGRRKSGVDFEDEARVIGVQDTPASPEGQEDEGEKTTPTQWPPLRRKDKDTAPSTPVAGRSARDKGKARADAGVDSTIKTEKTVSVKVVRTVERRVPRKPKGTPYVRGALVAAAQDEESDEAEEPSHHHPFSQPAFAPRIAATASNHSTSSNPRVSKADVSRLQRLLSGELREAPQPSPSKAERDSKPPADPPLTPPLPAGVPRVRAAPSRETISPLGAARDEDGERFNEFEERDEELPGPVLAARSSPLEDRRGLRLGQRPIHGEFLPQASSSHMSAANATSHVDKGKANATEASRAQGHMRRHTLAGPDARDSLPGVSHDISTAANRPARRSVPPGFAIGDDLPRTALSLLFNPRSYSLSHPPGSGSSLSGSPYASADVAAAKRLSESELNLVLEIGMGQVFRIMAENHGFGEPTVRDAFAATGSLEKTDWLLCKMRESANKAANEVLQAQDGDDEDQDDEPDVAEGEDNGDEEEDNADHDEDEAAPESNDEGESNYRPPPRNEEEEVEHVLESGFDAFNSHRGSSFGPHSRKRKSLIIKRVSPEPPPAEYSPPKRTRAGKHVARQSLSRASQAIAVGASDGSPEVGHMGSAVGFRQLMRFSNDQWRGLGSDGAKMATGKALAKLL
ncbi:hypothetical protein L226DRAFT_615571 [Lentinus tigrinus ALCF2SS1-7]|uniref:TERF2-interacting telomeric protein 1 Myb domain-containing protein n=1 Tax=Lentinus tigrinus ALCF2SS1-6 TaxID=1328759 RepID=A0A5C2RUL0_9APHY|nr:hypothetical protein L227DRAFT_579738 [Lentinus tigrinus ALCF2SS1-6]RPD71284.1 hypothetical protein L226DRAFT_615571 [Lentinus tigrinus ALCF2SS1-7]